MSWTEDLLAMITAFEPEFGRQVEGAGPARIAALEEVVGRPLPPEHREFLAAFGERNHPLFGEDRADGCVEVMLDYARGVREDSPGLTFDACVPLALGDSYEGFGLDLRGGGEERPVVQLDEGRPCGAPVAGSLPKLLFQHAYHRRCRALGYWACCRVPDRALTVEALAAQAEALGVRLEWYADARHFPGVRDDGAHLFFGVDPSTRPVISVAATCPEAVRELGDAFVAPFGGAFDLWLRAGG